jgi:hypothetical protein
MTADRVLRLLLLADALVVLCALPCSLLPFAWMDTVHRDWLGQGPLPDAGITRYLTRSLSLVYAMHGAVILAWLHILLGCAIVAVDLDAGVPWWWVLGEGPPLAGYGLVLLLLYKRASSSELGVP